MKAAKVNELQPGEIKYVELNDVEILLANIDGELYAVSDTCTHAYASLSDGALEGCQISCPIHGGVFDVITGEVIQGPPDEALERYAVKLEGDDILIGPIENPQ
ncbi:non-heme iron oxygenase ferredoxin subunit [SAR202 cluster bacterium AD-802-E10_MRT_200m]|nr:non-heme iron oxygenase ferredoxin subunit [SAR202 cluster bacterium AD-802-E10_MRT_200m]